MQLNTQQITLLETYAGGEYAYLVQSTEEMDSVFDDPDVIGDGLLVFMLNELSDVARENNNEVDFEAGIQALITARNQVNEAIAALTEAYEALQQEVITP